jgi:hypothetical protein
MFSWLIAPSKSLAEGMEIAFAIGIFITTFMVVVRLLGEYKEGEWWKRNVRIFEMLVVFGVAGEMLTETGAFWYSLKFQGIEESEIVSAKRTANDSALKAAELIYLRRTDYPQPPNPNMARLPIQDSLAILLFSLFTRSCDQLLAFVSPCFQRLAHSFISWITAIPRPSRRLRTLSQKTGGTPLS